MAQQYKGSVLLLLTAMIWGAALVAQSVSMDLPSSAPGPSWGRWSCCQ